MVQLGHAREVPAVAVSPDGALIATAGGGDRTACLWRSESGRQLRCLTGHTSAVNAVVFSPDGRRLLTGSSDKSARLWDVETGGELRAFTATSRNDSGVANGIQSVAMSPDQRFILAAGDDGSARLFDASTGEEVRRFDGHTSGIKEAAFSPDGRAIVTGSFDKSARLWETATGRAMQVLSGHADWVNAVAFSPDGASIATGSQDNSACWWDAASGRRQRCVTGNGGSIEAVAFSSDGRWLATGGGVRRGPGDVGTTITVWDARDGAEARRFGGTNVTSLMFSNDGRLAAGSLDKAATVWDPASGTETRKLEGRSRPIESVRFSPDGRFIVVAATVGLDFWDLNAGRHATDLYGIGVFTRPSALAFSPDGRFAAVTEGAMSYRKSVSEATCLRVRDLASSGDALAIPCTESTAKVRVDSVRYSPDGRHIAVGQWEAAVVYDAANGREVARYKVPNVRVDPLSFSPDGRFLLTMNQPGVLRLWSTSSRQPVWVKEFGPAFRQEQVAYSPDGRYLLVAAEARDVDTPALLSADTGQVARRVPRSGGGVGSVAFSADGRTLATGGRNGIVALWDTETGEERQRLTLAAAVTSVAFSPDGRRLLTGGADQVARLWDATSGAELCRLISFDRHGGVVVVPDGRFDTDDIEGLDGLHWVVPDQPLQPVPLEIFMREYYEPRLLPRVLLGERFAAVRALSAVNRVQPDVRITRIEPDAGSRDAVSVSIEVTDVTERRGDAAPRRSGAHDLRLFRDGQLVGYSPADDGPLPLQDGKLVVTFTGIRVSDRGRDVEFSAYAFNDDRVKSATARSTFTRPASGFRPQTAYIVAVGVNAYENPSFNLQFAASDARRLTSTLSRMLESSPYRVVTIPLISEEGRPAQPAPAATATREHVKTVIDLLAGRQVSAEARAAIRNADEIRRADPGDLVLLSFSSHGYADGSGRFYIVTSDTGPGTEKLVTPELLQRSISSDDLSHWLRDVDAGELLMIVDACQSAAAVEGDAFKPGPMGSRGLGQVAYDKGMRVLSATQAEDDALEHPSLQQGLLTYALVRDGLELGKADFSPKDNGIMLGEWLRYGTARVPQLYEEIRRRAHAAAGQTPTAETSAQRPGLFDFARTRREVLIGQPKK